MAKSVWFASAAVAAVAIFTSGASAANAQESAPPSDAANAGSQSRDLVVTAQRREQKLQDVPIAITALNARTLSDHQVSELQNVAREVPNMQFYPVPGNAASMQVFARGTEQANPGFNVSESPVGFYEDDVYRGRMNISNFDFPDVQRIEVLRGPQATLYGRNTLAGAVKTYTRTPGPDNWLFGSVAYGDFDTEKVSLSAGGPVATGLGASLSAVYHRQGRGFYVDETGLNRNIGDFDQVAVRGKLHWYGSDRSDLVLGVEYASGRGDGYNPIAYNPNNGGGGPPPDTLAMAEGARVAKSFYGIISPFNAFSNFSLYAATINYRYNLTNNITFKSITGYYYGHEANALDYRGGNYRSDGTINAGAGSPHNEYGPAEQYSEELQLIGNSTDHRLNWIAGAYLFHEDGNQVFEFYSRGSDQLDPSQLQKTERQANSTNSYAAFGQLSYEVIDRLTLTAGARYSEDQKNFTDSCTNGPASNKFNPFGTCLDMSANTPGVAFWSLGQKRNFSHTDWKLGVDFKATRNLLFYASVSTGFKAGGFQALCFGNEGCSANSFGPEAVLSYEGGVKSTLFGGRATLNATAYLAQYSQVQADANLDVGTVQENVGRLNVSGVEAELNANLTSELTVFGSIGTASGHYFDLNPLSVIASAPTSRFIPPDMPSWTGRLGFSFDHPMARFNNVRFLLGFDVYHSDSFYAQADDALLLPSYTRSNAHIGVAAPNDRWSLILSAQNVTDERTIAAGDAQAATNTRAVLAPRELLLTFSVKR